MSEIITTLTRGWHLARVLRLIFGLIALVFAYQLQDPVAGLAGVAIILMALLNLGCCAVGSCSIPTSKTKKNSGEDAAFEEIR